MNRRGRRILAVTGAVTLLLAVAIAFIAGGSSMIRQEKVVRVAAAPEQVFPWLTEPERLTRWLGGLVESKPLTPDGLRVGARSREVVVEGGRRMEMESVVTRYEPNRALAVRIEAGPFASEIDYELTPSGGATQLRYRAAHRMKGLMRLLAPFMAGPIRDKGERDLESLRKAVESAGS